MITQSLLDSMPIITCSGRRTPKVATEIVDKGVCASKGMYYHGLKLHALAFRRKDKLPFPEQLLITSASISDLDVFKRAWSDLYDRYFFGDKIYHNRQYFAELENEKNAIGATLLFNFMHYAIRPWPWIIVALASILIYPDLASIKA